MPDDGMRPERGRGSKLADFLATPGGAAYQQANNPLAAIQDADAPALGKGGVPANGMGRALGGDEVALADLARNATVFGPQAPHLSAGNPLAGAVDAPFRDPGYGHAPGFEGSGAQSAQLSDNLKRAFNYDHAMQAFGAPGRPSDSSAPLMPVDAMSSSPSGGPAGANFGFSRLRPRGGR